MKKSNSKVWLKEHFSDAYVKRARSEGFRARSVYKLIEINQRYRIIRPGMVIVDLGAAPGGWSEYASQLIGSKGKVYALDLLLMQPIMGVDFIQGDFTTAEIVERLRERLRESAVDVVLSDMAPNLSGIKIVDQIRAMDLAKRAFEFSRMVLKPGGAFLTKVFQGEEFTGFLQILRRSFSLVKIIKPDASRARSSEVFIVAKNLQENRL